MNDEEEKSNQMNPESNARVKCQQRIRVSAYNLKSNRL